MLTDSHCHLDDLELKHYDGDIFKAIAHARAKGVRYILCPGVTTERLPEVMRIVSTDRDLVAAIGVHPTEKEAHMPTTAELLTLAQDKKIVGIGETGLDFYYADNEAERSRQRDLFKTHIEVARELNKPLILHVRDASYDVIRMLRYEKSKNPNLRGVMHCFTGDLDTAKAAVELGFYLSFSGIVTFRNASSLREVAKNLPIEKILIETDAPYLAPEPMRGKPNEPAYLPYIAEAMAKLFNMPYEFFCSLTTENFINLFGKP